VEHRKGSKQKNKGYEIRKKCTKIRQVERKSEKRKQNYRKQKRGTERRIEKTERAERIAYIQVICTRVWKL
jgi:hypothetical protein